MAINTVTATGYRNWGLRVNGIQVVGEQGAAIADITPAIDGTVAGTTLNTVLAALRAHGLIAT